MGEWLTMYSLDQLGVFTNFQLGMDLAFLFLIGAVILLMKR